MLFPPGKKVKYIFVILLVLAVMAGMLPSSVPAEEDKTGRFVIVVVDRITLEDLRGASMPFLNKLFDRGALGLMNTTVPGLRVPANTFPAIGAGARILGGLETSALGFNAWEDFYGEKVSDVYRRWLGGGVKNDELIYLGLPQAVKANEDSFIQFEMGALGNLLHRESLKTAALGNADYEGQWRRYVLSLAIDGKGKVDMGDVGPDTYITDPRRIGGARTDFRYLLKSFKEFKEKADFIVIETGDTSRIAEGAPLALDRVVKVEKKRALARIDNFLEELTGEMDLSRDRLLLLTPTPEEAAYKESNSLTPIFMVGKGVRPGILTSAATKRPGVVTLMDIVPTVADYFQFKPLYSWAGLPIYGLAWEDAPDYLQQANNKMVLIFNARPILVKGYVGGLIILLLVALFYIYFKNRRPWFIKTLLVAATVVPVCFLYLALLPLHSIYLTVAEAFLLTILGTALALYMGRKNELDPFILVALFTSASIVIDVAIGSPMMKQSVLGYDPLAGARFYGIGNEYMGVLIGSTILGVTAWLSKRKISPGKAVWPVGLVFFLITIIIAAPNLGTNVGGTIAAVAGFGVVYFRLLGQKVTKKKIIIITAATILVVGGFISFDLLRGGAEQSHIGRTALQIKNGGIREVLDIIARKVAMNIKLIRYTIWSRVFLTSIGVLAVLFYRPIGIMQKVRDHYQAFFHGFIGVNAGSVVALIFNDSGIVAAATLMILPVLTLLYLLIQERREDGSRK